MSHSFLNTCFVPIIAFIAIVSNLPYLLPAVLPALLVSANVAVTYMKVARDLKRIDSTTRSPIYACFNESLNGIMTLRAFDGAIERFREKFTGLVDKANAKLRAAKLLRVVPLLKRMVSRRAALTYSHHVIVA